MTTLRSTLIRLGESTPRLRPSIAAVVATLDRDAAKKTETFKCPECGTKVLAQTGYCVKCQKKVKQKAKTASIHLTMGDTWENDHIRLHLYRGILKVTDLTNAGKRGKTVESRSVTLLDHHPMLSTLADALAKLPSAKVAFSYMAGWAESARERAPRGLLEIRIAKEKGVRVAPAGFKPITIRTKRFALRSDYDSFRIKDLEDGYNEPTCIPAIKGGNKSIKVFYRWVTDNKAKLERMSYYEVLNAMTKEGIRYHSYCAMD